MKAAQGVGLQASHPARGDPAGAGAGRTAVRLGGRLQNLGGGARIVAGLRQLPLGVQRVGSGQDRPLSPGVGAQIVGDGVQLGVRALQRGTLRGGHLSQQIAERVHSLTGSGRDGQGRSQQVPVGTFGLHQVRQGGQHGGHLGRLKLIGLVENAEGLRAGGGQRHHELAVNHRIGVLLGVDNPDEHIHVAHHAGGKLAVGGGDGIEVGHVQQN